MLLWCSWATLFNWRNPQILRLMDSSLRCGLMEEWWGRRRTKERVACFCHLSACKLGSHFSNCLVHLSLQNNYFTGRFSSLCTAQSVVQLGWQKSFLNVRYLKSEQKCVFVTNLAETKNLWSEKCDRSSCTPYRHRNRLHLTERRPKYNFTLDVTETRDLNLASHTLLYQAGGNSGASFMCTVGAVIFCDRSLSEQPGHRFYTTRLGNQSNDGTLFCCWGFF